MEDGDYPLYTLHTVVTILCSLQNTCSGVQLYTRHDYTAQCVVGIMTAALCHSLGQTWK